ncbi:MAG: DNA polymerase II [Treponema sp.]|jgi:DNA polymerase-2|nr:DNA polymerase II [Treponema sp.]
MTESGGLPFLPGFMVHAYADLRRDRLYLTGRLADGRSFAAMESRWRPSIHILREDLPRCAALSAGISFTVEPPCLEPFSGCGSLVRLRFSRYRDRSAAPEALEAAGVSSPDGDLKPPEAFLTGREIRGPLEIRGPSRPGRFVDLVFPDPDIRPPEPAGPDFLAGPVPLRIASIDIETDTRSGAIRAVGAVYTDAVRLAGKGESPGGSGPAGDGLAGTYAPPGGGPRVNRSCVRVVLCGKEALPQAGRVIFHPDERSMLEAFFEDLRAVDPDVLTGWNFLDFDFPVLAKRCGSLGIPFALGRGREEAKFFAGSSGPAAVSREDAGAFYRGGSRRSAAALVPGRQVIDALRIVRSGPRGGDGGGSSDFSLEAVSQRVLGEGKLVHSSGTDKIAELDRLYAEDPEAFGNYCYRDAELVPRILQKTGLFRLTMERAALTGVSLDKAWTSVVSFERVYGMELRKKGIAPDLFRDQEVSGAAGGTVLDPLPGFFRNVAVFDFRSLYPTIIRTFNVDPLSHARVPADSPQEVITAPNGAAFSRTPGVLPALIAGYFAARREALNAGDDIAAHVYKILMNSFYGVLGTGACRYARTELAGAITSFARKWLLASRDWFAGQGYRVLYGDTDSLFVETGLPDGAGYGDFASLCGDLAGELNRFLAKRISEEYRLESFLEMRFEKAYRRFLIPPLRALHESGEAARGRAKGYGGLLLGEDGTAGVEVKGMEAVRSDSTPLARRIQLELLELVFSGAGEAEFRRRVEESLEELRAGKLDGELVYRKRLSRPPEEYTASTPPQVKAARALGWKGRRGTVEYVWTLGGAEPASLPHGPLDYGHYAAAQLLPVAKSIADAAGWDMEGFFRKTPGHKPKPSGGQPSGKQMEFGF